ncbi:ABC transporter ATP-binding protein [Ferroacidibacillus organovorans]|uniref:Peptide ABC transporter ATP-binding protein n=1 Tax=Ferroacidibacillus organovorans TaxID=1765683 RepID=A0A853KEC2_9BACL|nr:ABC transporter ATP-binding protein [Ferroacidibacillus organovorans]KYP80903.1 peptide ABC transporter ATP-binding protein [Ferroacidibacillus organovorans]OAG95376.1 peptide ABC transporter ATP-binding protein [Ferroacidibacillus organovorans]
MSTPLLEVRNLKTHFISRTSRVRAVDGVDFSVERGKVLGIVGESGSGKSMTSLSIMRLVPGPQGQIVDGEILLDGKNLLKLTEREMTNIRGNQIGMIFQEPMTALNPVLKIGEQIGEVLTRHRGMNKAEAKKHAVELLKNVGFPRAEQIVNEYPHQLSGGMRQRAMIAMAMACQPTLLIADEPTTALDVTIQAQVLDLMRELKNRTGTAIILITHDLGVIAEMADDMVVMYGGQVVESGSADSVFEEPLHPYTRALLESIPVIDEERERLTAIPGTVPSAANFPEGCRFADRCSLVESSCREKMPELRELRKGHSVRCTLAV